MCTCFVISNLWMIIILQGKFFCINYLSVPSVPGPVKTQSNHTHVLILDVIYK